MTHAVAVALVDRRPTPWAAAFAALWSAVGRRPSDEQVRAMGAQITTHLNAERRQELQRQLAMTPSKSKQKRLRADLRRDLVPPVWPPAPPQPAPRTDGQRLLLESFTVDTDPEFFRQRHAAYRKAQRDRVPVHYLVYRKGEPVTIELHVPPPLPPSPPQRRAGGRPRKVSLERVRRDVAQHPGSTQVRRAERLGVDVRTIRDHLKRLQQP